MERFDIYKDIAQRFDGDVYLGVVGPVRTGKSTFITNFMNTLVLPNIKNNFSKQRAIDELPQSAQGKTIMTTQPKFVPNEAVKISLDDVEMNVRLIDCVGYMVQGAIGVEEADKPRFVKTPWSDENLPFDEAAEIGTRKVITDHSNVAVLVTTDGTFGELPRSSYVDAEERIVKELKDNHRPFVILLNTKDTESNEAKVLSESLSQKYDAPCMVMNATKLDENAITKVFDYLLSEMPVNSILVKMPKWLEALSFEHNLIKEVIEEVKSSVEGLDKIGDFKLTKTLFEESENFEPLSESKIIMGEGNIILSIEPKPELFYKVLSEQCGQEIQDDFHLISYLKELTYAKKEYDKIKIALDQVNETGYGVVFPNLEEMTLEDPEIVRQGSKFGVRLKASAPSLHIMRVDINTEVSPIVGTEQQSEDLVKYLLSEFESNPQGIWETDMFGKSLHMLVNEGLNNKLSAMPGEAQKKMRKTLSRIVNEGKGGVICILL
ncbi:MAG: stage IV sporulation protein A [Clostridiales bacterium]|nr:stage IV sporulation protein A [Candidatus Apopatousia equi]